MPGTEFFLIQPQNLSVGKGFCRWSSPILPCSARVSCSILLMLMSGHILKIFTDRDFTTSLDNLCQSASTLWGEKEKIKIIKLMSFWLWSLPLVLSLGALFFVFSYQIFIHAYKITLSLLFSKLSSPCTPLFILSQVLQSTNVLCGPSLDSLQSACIFLALEYPELDIALQASPLQGWEKSKHHPSKADGSIFPDALRDALGFPCCEGVLLVHGQFVVHQSPQGLLCQAAFQLAGP